MTDEEAIKQLAIQLCRADGIDPFGYYEAKKRELCNPNWFIYKPQAERAYELGARPKREFPSWGRSPRRI